MYAEQADGSLIISAGLTARVAAHLRVAGFTVQFKDLRSQVLPEPDYTKLNIELRDGQIRALTAIITSDGGIINAPTGAGKSTTIKQLCLMWHSVPIGICCPKTGVLRDTYMSLLEAMNPNEVGMIGCGKNEQGRRVTLTTDRSLEKCNFDEWRLFIFDEVHLAAAPKTSEVIGRIRNARMFGLSASWDGRSDGADLETEAMFGPEICTVNYEEVQAAGDVVPVEVWMIDCSSLPPYMTTQRMALERHGIWKNNARNNLIARAVGKAMTEYGKEIQVMISVKVVEHAVYLRHHLPTFEMVYGTMDSEKRDKWVKAGLLENTYKPISGDDISRLQAEFKSCKLKQAIATGVWGTGVDFPHLNVLVRADAQSSAIASTQIPGRVTRTGSRDNVKDLGIIIDMDDSHHPTLSRRALERVSVYKKKGWTIKWITL